MNFEVLQNFRQKLTAAQSDKRFIGDEVLVTRWIHSRNFYNWDKYKGPDQHIALPWLQKNGTLQFLMGFWRDVERQAHRVVLEINWNDTEKEMKRNPSYFRFPRSPKQLTVKDYRKAALIFPLYNTKDKAGILYRDRLAEGLKRFGISLEESRKK